MKNIKIICFDYYNTLVDIKEPFKVIEQWFRDYINFHEITVDSNKFYSRFMRYRAVIETSNDPLHGINLLIKSFEKACLFYSVESFVVEFQKFCEDLFMNPPVFKESIEVIKFFREKYRVGLLTNADNYILVQSLKKHSFEFDFILTSEDADANKPDIQIFNYALQKLNEKPEHILMVGDSPVEDIYGASEAGFRTVWINRNEAAYKEELRKPDHIIQSLKELYTIMRDGEQFESI